MVIGSCVVRVVRSWVFLVENCGVVNCCIVVFVASFMLGVVSWLDGGCCGVFNNFVGTVVEVVGY